MKWSVLGLVLVGIVAAVCAAVLVAAIQAGGFANLGQGSQSSAPVLVAVATRDLPVMTKLGESDVEVKSVPRSGAPERFYSDPVQVVGKVITFPVRKGQPFVRKDFAPEGSGVQLATALEFGMRAVSIALTEHGALYGLLYPGSVVDVIASFRGASGPNKKDDPVAVTLLKGIPVLGVESETVVSSDRGDTEDPKDASKTKTKETKELYRSRSGRWLVTLMVDPVQAQALQLVMQQGTITLAMRNPQDNNIPVDKGPTWLSQLTKTSGAASSGFEQLAGLLQRIGEPQTEDPSKAAVATKSRRIGPDSREVQQWVMDIWRGSKLSRVAFPLQGGGGPIEEQPAPAPETSTRTDQQ